MVLKLYGSAMSTARVLVTILEKELPYEHILIDIAKGDQKTDEYKKLQPFGKVPVLEDDGLFLYESRAICKYLARFVFSSLCSQQFAGWRARGKRNSWRLLKFAEYFRV
jgi:glutathione S-transferase